MALLIARLMVGACEAYAAVGLVFAVAFVPRALARMDPGVAAAPKTLRMLLLPGIAAFWPLFARRWVAGAHAPTENNPHRARAGLMESR